MLDTAGKVFREAYLNEINVSDPDCRRPFTEAVLFRVRQSTDQHDFEVSEAVKFSPDTSAKLSEVLETTWVPPAHTGNYLKDSALLLVLFFVQKANVEW